MFHYLFCCCFCKSKPKVQKGEKADPLVLKKAEAKPVYPGSIPEKQHHQSKIKLAAASFEQSAHPVDSVVIDIGNPVEPMSVPDVPAMEVPDLYSIEPMDVPSEEPMLTGAGSDSPKLEL